MSNKSDEALHAIGTLRHHAPANSLEDREKILPVGQRRISAPAIGRSTLPDIRLDCGTVFFLRSHRSKRTHIVSHLEVFTAVLRDNNVQLISEGKPILYEHGDGGILMNSVRPVVARKQRGSSNGVAGGSAI